MAYECYMEEFQGWSVAACCDVQLDCGQIGCLGWDMKQILEDKECKKKKAVFSIAEAKKMAGNSVGHYGGERGELPSPVIKFFDDKRRRRNVEASVQVFDMIGAQHFHVSIVEESDAVLDRSVDPPYQTEAVWRRCWRDNDTDGESFWEKFDSVSDAVHYIKGIWLKEFSSKTHRLLVRQKSYAKRLKRLGIKSTSIY